jgi:hypothetical protein
MSNELMIHEGMGGAIAQWRDPEQVLAEATLAAQALSRVITLKKNPVKFNGETYLELEDWQTVAKFYGLTAKILSTRYVEYGGVVGWEAEAVVLDRNQNEVSRAESMCMTDEDNWGAVPVYEWKDVLDAGGKKIWDQSLRNGKGGYKAVKEQVGAKQKPLFQLRSMAQTRACGKAFRQVLSWVVVLGGFKPNVAEEMIESQLGPEREQEPERKPVAQPSRASEKKDATQPIAGDPVIETICGMILSAKHGAKGSMWVRVGDELIAFGEAKVVPEIQEGNYLSVKALKKQSDKIGTFYDAVEVLKCEAADNVAQTDNSAEDVVAVSVRDEGAVSKTVVEGIAAVKNLFDSGVVTTANKLQDSSRPPEKPGTIGHKKATRLHILIRQYSETSGFTEAELEKIKLGFGVEHARDIPAVAWDMVEGYAKGTDDRWKRDYTQPVTL